MKRIYTLGLALGLFLFLPNLGHTQNHIEAGLTLGYTNYFGDLVEPAFTFIESHPAAQLFFRKTFDAHHAYRLNLLHGKISGNDKNYESLAARGNSFEMSFIEISSIGEIDLFGKKRYPKKGHFKKSLTPYILVGLGVVLGKPEVSYANPENEDNSIEYPKWHVSIPAGFGLKKDINENIFLGLEIGHRFTLSDNLDGVQLSGNANFNDAIFFGGLSIGFRITKNPAIIIMDSGDEEKKVKEKKEKKEKAPKEKKEKKKKG